MQPLSVAAILFVNRDEARDLTPWPTFAEAHSVPAKAD